MILCCNVNYSYYKLIQFVEYGRTQSFAEVFLQA